MKPKFQSHATQRTLREKKKLILWMNQPSKAWWASLNKRKDLSTRKEAIINLGLIWKKDVYPSTNVLWKPNNEWKKEKIINSANSRVSEHTIQVYSDLYCCIHADVNKRQITGGKNSSDKIEEKKGNIPPLINLRFGARALPLDPKVLRKTELVYHWRTTFSPSVINIY